MDTTTDYLAEAVTEAFGVRCRDSHEDCHCCRAWRQYDDIASLRSKLEEAEGALTLLLKMHEAHHNNPVHAAARRTLASLREADHA